MRLVAEHDRRANSNLSHRDRLSNAEMLQRPPGLTSLCERAEKPSTVRTRWVRIAAF
jgi:hypothetical protein